MSPYVVLLLFTCIPLHACLCSTSAPVLQKNSTIPLHNSILKWQLQVGRHVQRYIFIVNKHRNIALLNIFLVYPVYAHVVLKKYTFICRMGPIHGLSLCINCSETTQLIPPKTAIILVQLCNFIFCIYFFVTAVASPEKPLDVYRSNSSCVHLPGPFCKSVLCIYSTR